MIKVVLDTSVLVAGLLSPDGSPAEILRRWRDGWFDVVVSPLLLEELRATLAKSKILLRVSGPEADAFVAALGRIAVMLPDAGSIEHVTRDPSDFLVALAREAKADAIVSVDRNVLEADALQVLVLRPADFLSRLVQR